eukprot:4365250-Pyramimonas_sp.AAC.1
MSPTPRSGPVGAVASALYMPPTPRSGPDGEYAYAVHLPPTPRSGPVGGSSQMPKSPCSNWKPSTMWAR